MEQSVIVSWSLSARPPESFVQSDRRGLTQGGRDVSSISAPKGEFVVSENNINAVKRRETVVNHAFFIAGNGDRAVEVASVKTPCDVQRNHDQRKDLTLNNSAFSQQKKQDGCKSYHI